MLESLKTRFGASPQNRRRDPREDIEDGTVVIKGQTFQLHDWSARAFMAKPCTVDCEATERIEITSSARFADGPIEFTSRAIVVRIDRDEEELAAYFAMLDEATQANIKAHFDAYAERLAAEVDMPVTARPAPVAAPQAAPAPAPQAAPAPAPAPPVEATPAPTPPTTVETEAEPEPASVADAPAPRDAAETAEAAEADAECAPADQPTDAEPADTEPADVEATVVEPAATAPSSQPSPAASAAAPAGGKSAVLGVEEIKRRAAAAAAEMAVKSKVHSISAIFDLGARNMAAFREKVDAAGITKILQETPRIKVFDHDSAYGFGFQRLEFTVFVDWESGGLCRDVSLESGGRRVRIIGIDHDAALDEMIDCLARMLGQIEADATR